ncbi:D-glycero-beta-D-manno-heptose-7-phosphate kinase [Syntrophobacter fumaroxidans]|uniref:D-glycero-beta-D-manno-heptose-7-phosphate kinase n=1 Tax=Syntrophobacter fumaroxidans TaxID=119484 RepID=UPI0002DF24A9|nr:D-glycero-beta-D-manno-heptose-7-phosphate kinase [Syntrophobacter fumaroxidans]
MPNHPDLTASEKQRLREAVSSFPQFHLLVAGDLMLDTFIWGEVRRISPEAPVPVVEVREETRLLGGTANVVHNVSRLGGKVSVVGAVGDDSPGRLLRRLLDEISVETDGLITIRNRPTTVKTRIIARNQQVVRIDHESSVPVSGDSTEGMLDFIRNNLPRIDGIVISDYAKGVVTPEFMDAVRAATRGLDIPVIVDPKVKHAEIYREVTMVTPNHHEAARMAGIEIHDEDSLVRAGRHLLEHLNCKAVLITRGKDGMSLFHHTGGMDHIPTVARRVFDVTGAGDTVSAVLGLGVASGLTMKESALLANLAAGIVVGEVGTAAVSAAQLLSALDTY